MADPLRGLTEQNPRMFSSLFDFQERFFFFREEKEVISKMKLKGS